MTNQKFDVDYIQMDCIRDIRHYYKVGHQRWQNAISSYQRGDYLISVYLAGYSVECILKYAILESLYSNHSPILSLKQVTGADKKLKPLRSHMLNKLMEIGNQRGFFTVPKESDYPNVISWKSEWRYAYAHKIDQDRATMFLKEAVRLSEDLKNETVGKIKISAFQFY